MHKFLKSIGFSDLSKKEIAAILSDIVEHPDEVKSATDSEGNEFAELTFEYAPGIGLCVCGTYDENDKFQMDYYYPYLRTKNDTTKEQIEVHRHAERESYSGVCDEIRLGVTLIFFMQNVTDYLREQRLNVNTTTFAGASLSALGLEAKVLLPIAQKEKVNQMASVKQSNRSELIAMAREGDEAAIESLTLEDMDTYAIISRRILREDVLSIVKTYFMPYGVESDQYEILGEIKEIRTEQNKVTAETLYCMKIECNDIIFDVCINQNNLYGAPEVGRRFKGIVWMQGLVNFGQPE